MMWFLFWIGVNFLIGYAIGKPKDQAISSALICVLLGPIGWIISAASSGNTRQCPHCAERVKAGATVCRYCGRDLPKITPSAPVKLPPTKPLTPRDRIILLGVFAVMALFIAGLVWFFRPNPAHALSSGTIQSAPPPSLTATPQPKFITLVKPVTVSNGVMLPAGTTVGFISRNGDNVRFHYGDSDYEIPLSATDLK